MLQLRKKKIQINFVLPTSLFVFSHLSFATRWLQRARFWTWGLSDGSVTRTTFWLFLQFTLRLRLRASPASLGCTLTKPLTPWSTGCWSTSGGGPSRMAAPPLRGGVQDPALLCCCPLLIYVTVIFTGSTSLKLTTAQCFTCIVGHLRPNSWYRTSINKLGMCGQVLGCTFS